MVTTVRLIASELRWGVPIEAQAGSHVDANVIATFDQLYDKLLELGLPITANKDECRETFVTLRAEYAASISYIAESTLILFEEEEPDSLHHTHV